VDGDGFADVLVGAYLADTGGTQAGAAYLVYGPVTGTLDLSSSDAIVRGDAGDALGRQVGHAGDTDGDGLADLFVSASADDTATTDAGAVLLWLGTSR
jgi:hypothetical protein